MHTNLSGEFPPRVMTEDTNSAAARALGNPLILRNIFQQALTLRTVKRRHADMYGIHNLVKRTMGKLLCQCALVNKLWADEATSVIWSCDDVELKSLEQISSPVGHQGRRQYYANRIKALTLIDAHYPLFLDEVSFPRLSCVHFDVLMFAKKSVAIAPILRHRRLKEINLYRFGSIAGCKYEWETLIPALEVRMGAQCISSEEHHFS